MNSDTLNEAMMRHDNAGPRVMQTRRWMRPTRSVAEGTTRLATRLNVAPGTNRDLDLAATVDFDSSTATWATNPDRSHQKTKE